jgi:hypothetical protein
MRTHWFVLALRLALLLVQKVLQGHWLRLAEHFALSFPVVLAVLVSV